MSECLGDRLEHAISVHIHMLTVYIYIYVFEQKYQCNR